MRRLLAARLALLRQSAFRRGVVGTSGFWFAVWGFVTVLPWLRRRVAAKPVVERFALRPGEVIMISDLGRPDAQP